MVEIDIDIDPGDIPVKRKVRLFEDASEMLDDLLSSELVAEARRLAPVSLRTSIQRRKTGDRWRVYSRDASAETYIESAVLDFDWRSALRRLLSKLQ